MPKSSKKKNNKSKNIYKNYTSHEDAETEHEHENENESE